MENTQDINSILAKLKKLQRLYEGAKAINSEAEAQNAAVKIQNLLTQYNLLMADLEAVPDNEQKINDYVAEKFPNLGKGGLAHIGSSYAMALGQEDGRKVNITKGGIAASNTNPNRIAQ